MLLGASAAMLMLTASVYADTNTVEPESVASIDGYYGSTTTWYTSYDKPHLGGSNQGIDTYYSYKNDAGGKKYDIDAWTTFVRIDISKIPSNTIKTEIEFTGGTAEHSRSGAIKVFKAVADVAFSY